MTRRLALRLLVALIGGALVPAGCGGSDSPSDPTFRVTGVSPDTSVDLDGGDTVMVFGERFLDANVVGVRFGGTPATNLNVLDQETLTVDTPPAPGGIAQVVTIEVVSTLAGSKFLTAAYTYVESSLGPPDVTSMNPTVFTPTGAEAFTLGGTSLGAPGGTSQVFFSTIGNVAALVSQTGTFAAGNAPITGAPPTGDVTVTLDNGVGTDTAPSPVTYVWGAPIAFPIPPNPGTATPSSLSTSPAGIPVRVSEDHAVMCSPGPDTTWRTPDDQLFHIFRPTGGGFLVAELLNNGASVGYLDPVVSVPAVLDGNTVICYWVGPDRLHSSQTGVPPVFDDALIRVASLRTTPSLAFVNLARPAMPAPVVAVSSSRILVTSVGNDSTPSTADDALVLMEWTGTSFTTAALANIGALDNRLIQGNLSVPFSVDGENVFIVSITDPIPGNINDALVHSTATAMNQAPLGGGSRSVRQLGILGAAPVPLSATLVAALGGGMDNTAGTTDDTLSLFDASAGLMRTDHVLPSIPQMSPSALRPIVAGPGGEALVPLRGGSILPADGDERLAVYTNPLAGTNSLLNVRGPAQVMSLRNGESIAFDSGFNLTPGIDDVVRYLDATFSSVRVFNRSLNWTQPSAIYGDDSRIFAVGAGSDGRGNSGDETLQVWQVLALGAAEDAVVLPLSTGIFSPVPLNVPFVPVSTDWGVVLSPGADGVFGGLASDDMLVIARY